MVFRQQLTLTLVSLLLVGSSFYPASFAHASGFALFTQGASALGQGNAVTAHADDPTAIFFNPALINRLGGTQLEIGTTLMFSGHEFTSAQTGMESRTKGEIFYPSTFFLTHKLTDALSVGLGVFTPFGLGTEWDGNWEGRYISTKSELQTYDINPVASYQITPAFSVAAGIDVLLLEATLEKKIPSTALGIPGTSFDIGQKFKGDGVGIGFNAGVAYDVNTDITFGAAYRSRIRVDINGNSSTDVNSTTASFTAPLNSAGKTEITLPQQVTAGIAYKGFAPLTLEAGLRWEGWSSFDQLLLKLDSGQSSATKRNWNDVFGLNLGAKYRVNDTLSLLAGYLYGTSPVPDDTFDPSIPDANTHVFSVGTDIDYRKMKIAVAYAYQMLESRTKNNAVGPFANGEYNSDAHMLSVSLTYKY